MRRLRPPVLVGVLVASLFVAGVGPAGGQRAEAGSVSEGGCPAAHVEVRGIVRDVATGLPLAETANVDIYLPDGTPVDGGGTGADSRYIYCAPVEQGDIKIRFDADSYRAEWWNDQPDLASADVITISVANLDPVIANAALTPDGRVIAGRVTNMNGVPRVASIGIWRRGPDGVWRGIDGEGNDPRTGRWSYRVPSYGRYRVSACVDHHWCQWATSADRLRFARTIVVGPSTVFINDVDIRVPFCRSSRPDFCVPLGFLS